MRKSSFFLVVASSIVLFDVMASIVSRMLQLEYADFGVASLVIYFVAGFSGSWKFSTWTGVVAGSVAGLTDSTLGLFLSQLIGPYTSFDYADLSRSNLISIVVFVVAEGTILASFGALIALLVGRFSGANKNGRLG
jgi:hypothetical protein